VRYPLAYEARPLAVFMASGIERRPDPADRVGKALAQLVREHPGVCPACGATWACGIACRP
jgi:hypothetical protein